MSLLGSRLGDRSHLHQACWVILGATEQYPGQRRPLCSGRAAPFPTWIQGPGSEAGPPPVAFPTAFPRNLVFVSLRVNRHRKRPPGCLSPPPAGPTHPVYKFSACLALLCKHSACLPLAVDSPLNLSSLPAPPLSAQPCVRVTPCYRDLPLPGMGVSDLKSHFYGQSLDPGMAMLGWSPSLCTHLLPFQPLVS